MINVIISDKIYIYNAPEIIKRIIKEALTLPNPVYQVMLRRHNIKALYAVKKNFKYYEEDINTGVLIIGRGCEERLKRLCKKMNLELSIDYRVINTKLSDKFLSKNLVLRDYQLGAPEQILKHKNGIIKLGTGYGKTILALRLIEILQLTALIIVPRNIILNQFKEELKKYYDYEAGIIQGKTWNIKDITLASIQTLKQRNKDELSRKFSIIFCDEAHTTISTKGIGVVQTFNPKYLYGLTATPDRSDGQGNAIQFTFGDIIIDKELPQNKPIVEIIKSNCPIEVNDEYADMINMQIRDEPRNRLILGLVGLELLKDRKILILTKRIVHYETIKNLLSDKLKIFCISSNDKQADRDKLLNQLRTNEKDFDIILGTYSMLSIGVDIPALDTLLFAGDLKSSILTQQSAGRILRIFEGKQHPKVIDIDDNLNGILHRQALARKRFYKQNNWKII